MLEDERVEKKQAVGVRDCVTDEKENDCLLRKEVQRNKLIRQVTLEVRF